MIECENIIKQFGSPPQTIIHGLSFKIPTGEFVSISGKSGSGKSTLLYLISTLDLPTSGTVKIDGHDIGKMRSDELHRFRNEKTGFIFQFHYLLPELTALENVLLPARNLGRQDEFRPYALELLGRMEVDTQAHKLPSQMSGGQQQRVAIARALLLKPSYLFADEPTGNLDTQNAMGVMKMIVDVNKNHQTTVVLVTHEPEYAAMADREIFLVDGKISDPI